MCSRTWRACDSRCRVRSESSVASQASRYAASGTLASTITTFSPGRRTIRSGRSASVVGRDRDLLVEVAVRQHSRQLDDALQLNLPPAPPDVRGPQRSGEGRRALAQLRQLAPERPVRPLSCQLQRSDLAVDFLERLLQRPDVPRQLGLGDLEERRAVCLVGVGGCRANGIDDLVVERAALDVELRPCSGELRSRRRSDGATLRPT